MSTTDKKRLSFIINIAYFAIILVLFYLIFKTFFGLLVPFITAFLFAAVFNKPVRFIEKKTPLKRSVLSAIFVVIILGVFVGLISLVGMGIVDKLKGFYQYIIDSLKNVNGVITDIREWAVGAVSFLPENIRLTVTDSITAFFNRLTESGTEEFSFSELGFDWSSLLSKGGSVIKDTVVQIPSLAVSVLITVVASVFMLSDFDSITKFIAGQIPENKYGKMVEARNVAFSTLKQMAKAYGLIILITMTELCIGLYILKFSGVYESDYIVLISLIIAVIDIIPVLGTGTVLIPWAVYSFVTGSTGMGVGLVILYAVILIIRQVIEPKLVAGQVGLSPIVTIIAMYIGTKTLGLLGFFILPFIVILIKKFNDNGIIHLFNSRKESDFVTESAVETAADCETDKKN